MQGTGMEARRFVRAQQHGVLSTLSQRLEGYPFGSVSPFITDLAGCPVILISDIAEHSKNIQSDPRVSLIVQPFSADMQETARATIVGRAQRLPDKDGLGPRYLRHFPQAETYFAMHDFHFYRIEPVRVRWIGGFGKIHWIEANAYLAETGRLGEAEASILEHMNADHADSLKACCRHVLGLEVEAVEMIGIDPDGFDLRADSRVHRIEFAQPVTDATAARQALVALCRP